MVQEIIKSLNYEVGDIVYLWYDNDVLTCKAEVLEYDGELWKFKPLEKQSIYSEDAGTIPFTHKPVVFAKETDERRAEK